VKKLVTALMLGLVARAVSGQAADVPERAPEYAHLEMLIGRWTTEGSESSFVEVCDWYHGRFHVVCHSERKRPDGSTGHGMSVLSYVPGAGYVYTGIGSRGRYETLEAGVWSGGSLTFTSTAIEDGKSVVTRIQVGPSTDRGMPFVVDTATDGGAWTRVETTMYVKLP
jgi:hypothetical protein